MHRPGIIEIIEQDKANEPQKIIIHGRLAGANEYINACRTNKFGAAKFKNEQEKLVRFGLMEAFKEKTKVRSLTPPLKLTIHWYEPNSRRDIDNICFGTKFILDALVKNEWLPNDNQKVINQIIHYVDIDKDNPRIEIEVRHNG